MNQVHQLAKATVRNIYDELALEPDPDKCKALFKFIQRSESERSLNAQVNLARTDPRIAVSVAAFDTQPHLLNCVNGTIDLRDGELLPHRREDLLTKTMSSGIRCLRHFPPVGKVPGRLHIR